MSAADSRGWWRRNRRAGGALLLGLVAACGLFAAVDVVPRVMAEDSVDIQTADSPKDQLVLGSSTIGPVSSQFFPDDVVAFSDPPPGSKALWVKVTFEDAPDQCVLRLSEVGGQRRTWVDATPILNWDAPDDGPALCIGRGGEDFGLLNAFALPPDAAGPFLLEVVVRNFDDQLVRVARFEIAPTLAQG
jgi:hypothetical protein